MEIHRGLNATLTFEKPSTVTIIRDSDGEKVIDAEATEVLEETNVLKISGADIPQVDLLKVSWTDTEGIHRKEIEVVGGFVCTVEEVKVKLDMQAKNLPSDSRIQEAIEQATKDIEEATWDAYRHRYASENLRGDGSDYIALDNRNIVEILAVEVDGDTLSEEELDDVEVTNLGIERTSGRFINNDKVVVKYVYGHENFSTAKEPVRDLAAFRLTPFPTNWDGRSTSYTNEDGTYRLVTEGVRGAQFSLPRVNAFVQNNSVIRIV